LNFEHRTNFWNFELPEQYVLSEKNKVPADLVLIWSDALPKNAQGRIAIALWQITEHLIIGAILFDDVNACLKKLGSPTRSGTGLAGWSGRAGKAASCKSGYRIFL